ncbi:MAG: HAMP domain-containing histidine kinase [SAR202 cluster bacterium]|nr:HAMP domain-containing histidine kinase [SAR202 cluster bacterium]
MGLQEYRYIVARLGAVLYLLAGAIAASTLGLPGVRETVSLTPAAVLIALAVPAAAGTYLFPWRRVHHHWYLVVTAVSSLHLGLFVWATGGWQSPFMIFVLFIVLIATAYFSKMWPLLAVVLLALGVVASPLAYQRPVGAALVGPIVIELFIIGVSVGIARLLFFWLERSLVRSAHLEDDRTDFLLAVAHHLKTPLTSLGVALQLLQGPQGREPSQRDRLLDAALRSEKRLEQAVQRLLESFRSGSFPITLRFEPILLQDAVQSVVETLRSQVEAFDQRLTVTVPADLPVIRADRERLELVIANLLQNAVDFAGEQGAISVSAERSNGHVMLQVSNSGPGFTPRERQMLFQSFSGPWHPSSQNRRRTAGGTGVGLMISKVIVEAHGGRIFIASEDDNRAGVCVTLPVLTASGDAARA